MQRDDTPSVPSPDENWRLRLQWRKVKIEREDGAKEWIEVLDSGLRNVITLLRCLPEWRGVLAYDEFSLSIVTLRQPPWSAGIAPRAPWRRGTKWTDEDFIRVRDWFAHGFDLDGRHYELKTSKSDIEDAVPIVAQSCAIHPLREHYDALQWDGADRIGGPGSDIPGWLHVYLGAKDTDYTRAVGRWWIVSLAARTYKPGCQVDHMLVLEGAQGRGKSTALRILGGPFFTDQIPIDGIATKDGKQLLHSGKQLVEFAELDGLTRAEASRVKASISTTHDFFRAPYAKGPKEHPRHNVFAGSVNDRTWLKDETGNRRFWPVAVEEEHPIAISLLTRDRDQLLGQAVELFRRGDRWWPAGELTEKIEDEQSSRLITDDWSDRIAEWLQRRDTTNAITRRVPFPYVTTAEIGTDALGIEIGRWGKSEQMRAGGCLTRLGFERVQISHNGRRSWVYRPPDKSPLAAAAE